MGTVPELAHWRNTHPHHDSVTVDNQSLTVSARSSSPEFIDKEANEMGNRDIPRDDDFDCDTPVRSLSRQSFQNYFFPVSNSPVDIVTMLTRLACFTGSILNVLTPRLPRSSLRTSSNVSSNQCIVLQQVPPPSPHCSHLMSMPLRWSRLESRPSYSLSMLRTTELSSSRKCTEYVVILSIYSVLCTTSIAL